MHVAKHIPHTKLTDVFKQKLSEPYEQNPVRTACLFDLANGVFDVVCNENDTEARARFLRECGFPKER